MSSLSIVKLRQNVNNIASILELIHLMIKKKGCKQQSLGQVIYAGKIPERLVPPCFV